MADPKGERLKVGFDGSLRFEFHGAKVTSDAGLLAYRDLDEALGLFDSVPSVFHDSRTGRNIQHHLASLLRQSVYSRLAGYEDVNDAHRLSVDPTMRRITGKKTDKKNAASANTMGRFETQMLSVKDNLKALSEVNGQWVERALEKTPHRRIILDCCRGRSATVRSRGLRFSREHPRGLFRGDRSDRLSDARVRALADPHGCIHDTCR
ncbi:transposase [Acidobacteria bacterium AH-259-L09]|nr:transposase [Acidobacteria bacterium AH-259-L09]